MHQYNCFYFYFKYVDGDEQDNLLINFIILKGQIDLTLRKIISKISRYMYVQYHKHTCTLYVEIFHEIYIKKKTTTAALNQFRIRYILSTI